MNLRLFAIIFTCAAAPAIAFPLGIKVGSGWVEKIGPRQSSEAAREGVAKLRPVRTIAPGTLDGQPVPGRVAAGPPRALSPVYPTADTPERDMAAEQGLVPAKAAGPDQPQPAATPAAGPAVAVPAAFAGQAAQPDVDHYGERRHGRRYGHRWRRIRYAARHRYRYAHYRYPGRGSSGPISLFADLFR